MKVSLSFVAVTAVLIPCFSAQAEVWNLPAGGTWNAEASWTPATIPSAIGANATFNNALTGSNPAQTGNRTVTTDAAQTVGSIQFNNSADSANTFTNSITAGSSGSLILDAVDAGPATINVSAAVNNTGNNTISAPMTLTDDLVATVDNISATSAAGALNLTATISGPGGFTKLGDGLATFGTGLKTYTGATVLSGGRFRMSLTARPTATSSFTINAGAQLDLITTGVYTFGSGPLNLNGNGAVTGPFSPFPGAIRNDTNLEATITNSVVLQSNTLIHVQGAATGSTTLSGNVSGVGQLAFIASNSDNNLGKLVLTGTNSYEGGTLSRGGTLIAGAASITAFGTGNVTIQSGGAIFGGATSKLTIETGATNAINDLATLSLAGSLTPDGIANDGYADLGTDINETVGALILGGTAYTLPGTYGSASSGADHQFDEFFAGLGKISLAAVASVPGDFNGNGSVDAADYVLWRKGGPLQNEVSNSGTVDDQDYLDWRARFGNPTPGSGSGLETAGGVPEPATLSLVGLAVALIGILRRRRVALHA